jgi:arylsulfatase A-like enzyme
MVLRALSRCVLAAAALIGALRAPAWSAPATPAAAWRPSIVLVTLDTTRADHLGCYGYPRQTTPFIDSLAAQGALFMRAFATTATTTPSHASLFTGLYPRQHRVRENGDVLDDGVFTLAEWLRMKDYDTAAFVGTRAHFKRANFNQGFRVFNEPPAAPAKYRTAAATIAAATRWLGRQPAATPLFIWIHLFDAHLPYDPANRLAPASAAEADELVRYWTETQRVPLEFFGGDRARLIELMTQYDGQLQAIDRSLRTFYDAVRGARPDALWIVTNDHGEGLGSHNWMEHGKMLYNEQLRAPLIVHATNGRVAARRVECVVEQVDLFPTVADLLGAPLKKRARNISGRSLAPLLSGADCGAVDGLAFSQRRAFRIVPDRPIEFEAGRKYALQNARYKYILWTDGPHEFYDLQQDPYETTNLFGSGRPEEAQLRQALQAEIERQKPQVRSRAQVDQATRERLRALGY